VRAWHGQGLDPESNNNEANGLVTIWILDTKTWVWFHHSYSPISKDGFFSAWPAIPLCRHPVTPLSRHPRAVELWLLTYLIAIAHGNSSGYMTTSSSASHSHTEPTHAAAGDRRLTVLGHWSVVNASATSSWLKGPGNRKQKMVKMYSLQFLWICWCGLLFTQRNSKNGIATIECWMLVGMDSQASAKRGLH